MLVYCCDVLNPVGWLPVLLKVWTVLWATSMMRSTLNICMSSWSRAMSPQKATGGGDTEAARVSLMEAAGGEADLQ